MAEYRGHIYFKDEFGLWNVVLEDGAIFIVALDDSKHSGRRKINWKNNTEEVCRRFIDKMLCDE